jgi:hypothetical protein
MMKLALMRTATGKEDRVTSAAEEQFIKVNSTSDCSPNKCFKVQVTDTSQHQLFSGVCVNQAFMVKLLQRNHY